MRVLFLNTADVAGGAAIAAMRIAKALEKYHSVEIKFLVSEKFSDKKNVIQTRPKWLWFLEKSYNKIACYFGYQYIFIPFSSCTILKEAKKFKPDIIHLHNIHGGYIDFRTIEKLSKFAPIIWTLHDAWLGTAHCAVITDCYGFKEKCLNCVYPERYPELFRNHVEAYKKKQDLLRKIVPLLVSPSLWLKDILFLLHSENNIELLCISNCIDIDKFKPVSIRKNRKAILFSSVNLDYVEKGGDFIIPMLKKLDKKLETKISAHFVGKTNKTHNFSDLKNIEVKILGLKTSNEIPEVYKSVDLFISMSKSENQPLTVMEAMSCGIPVVAFSVGGISEMVVPGKTGELAKPFDLDEFVQKVILLINDNKVLDKYSRECRKFIEENCSEKIVSNKYLQIYHKSLLK